MSHYVPPKQSKISQLFDVVILLALTFGALYIPLFMGLAGGAKVDADPATLTSWDTMKLNPTEVAQYTALGLKAPSDNPGIFARFDYTINWGALVVMVVVILAYYAMMLRFSDKEYREVISEKFDK